MTYSVKKVTRDNYIRLIDSSGIHVYVPVPFGLTAKSFGTLEYNEAENFIDLYKSEKDETGCFTDCVRLYLTPTDMIINHDKSKYSVQLTYNSLDLTAALDILFKEHYISKTPTGIPVVLKNISTNEIIGVIFFSRLLHGNPLGRQFFLNETKKVSFKDNEQFDSDCRDFAKRHIGLIDRVAMKREYQGIGLGSKFVESLGPFMQKMFVNELLCQVEVMTSWTISEFSEKYHPIQKISDLKLKEDDFFTKAGYIKCQQVTVKDPKNSGGRIDNGLIKRMSRKNRLSNGINTVSKQVVAYYYIKEL